VEGKASHAAIYNDDSTFTVITSKGIKIAAICNKYAGARK
jgi:hypothetical protein